MSIVTRIFGLIAFTLLLVAGGEIVNGLNLHKKRLAELRADTVQLARIAELDMVRILEGAHQLLATLAKLPDGYGWDARACSVLEATASSDFEYDHIVAVDRGGTIQCSSSGANRVAIVMTDAKLLASIVATAGFSVGTYGIGAVSRNEVLRVGYPVVDEAGAVVGAVYAGINVTWLNTALGQWRLGEKAVIDITDRNGIVIARHPDSRGVGQPINPALARFLSAATTGVADVPRHGGDIYMYGYVPLNVGESSGLAVFVGRDKAQAFADLNRSIRLNVAVVLAGLMLAAILIAIYVRRFLARPFQDLLDVAGRWRDGDWSARAGGASGIREFDRLASAFDGMAAEVSVRDRSLQHRDLIMEAITRSAAELVTGGAIADAIPRILQTVGEAIQVDRVLVFEAPASCPPVSLRYAWHGPAAPIEVRPDFFSALSSPVPAHIADWLKPLGEGSIVATTRRDVGGAARELFDRFKIVSNLQMPIVVGGARFGQLCIDDCHSERNWTDTETHAVSVLADLIGAAIERERHLNKLSDADAVVRNSPAIVYRLSGEFSPPRLTYISENVSQLGVSAAELIANPGLYLALIHPDDRDAIKSGIDAGIDGALEFRIADASGTYHWMESRHTPNRDASGRLLNVAGALIDVTQRKSAEDKLQFANTLLTTLRDTSPDAILVVDANQRIISVNQQFAQMWGVPADLIAAGDDNAVLATVAAATKNPDEFVARVRYIDNHTEEAVQDDIETIDGRFLDRHTNLLRTADGRRLGRVWFFRDVSERRQAEAKIIRMARFDLLTGLANRGVFVEELLKAIGWAHRGAAGFAVLYLDLDHFKDINDTLGHPIGDLLLQAVGQRLRAAVRETDTVARFGGDEFAVILSGLVEPADAATLADKILQTLIEPFSIKGNVIRTGASVGIAVYGPDSLDAEALLSHADVALYRAKSEGRGTYRFFTDAMDAEVRKRVTMTAELRDAITQGQLFLLYQPQVEIETGRIVGMEALARWHHPTRGLIAPSEFIPVAERSGLIVALGAWVMRETCWQTRRWIDAGIAPPSVGFNLSGLQFKTPLELEKAIAAALVETGVPPHCLELELTESVLMDASREHNDVLIRLRQMGLRIAIDDFGTGFSSLDYLRRFPVDRIKIAQVFVTDLGAPENTAIVKAALGLARSLSIEVIVEGVDSDEQLALLSAWGCRYVQGYYFAKPQPVAETTALLRIGTIALDRDAFGLVQSKSINSDLFH